MAALFSIIGVYMFEGLKQKLSHLKNGITSFISNSYQSICGGLGSISQSAMNVASVRRNQKIAGTLMLSLANFAAMNNQQRIMSAGETFGTCVVLPAVLFWGPGLAIDTAKSCTQSCKRARAARPN